jgi:hypothetical protein
VDENVFDAFVNNDFEALDEDTLEALVNEYLIVSENENEDDFFNRILYEAIFKNELNELRKIGLYGTADMIENGIQII